MKPEQIVEFLTMHRIVHGLTPRDVAEAATPAMAASTIMRYERRESSPHLDALAAWADALGFDLEIQLKARTAHRAPAPADGTAKRGGAMD